MVLIVQGVGKKGFGGVYICERERCFGYNDKGKLKLGLSCPEMRFSGRGVEGVGICRRVWCR